MIYFSFILALYLLQSVQVQARPGFLQKLLHPHQSSSTLPNSTPPSNCSDPLLHKRQTKPFDKTCGFLNGDSGKPRTADQGYGCRVDTANGLWGFCPTSVIVASDCGLAGVCFDAASCRGGCGKTGTSTLTTFTCSVEGAPFCSFAALTAGPDQLYSYIACGKAAIREVYFATATTTPVPFTTTPTTTSKASTIPKTTTTSQPPLTTTSSRTSSTSLSSSSSTESLAATTSPPRANPSQTSPAIVSIETPPPNNVGAIVGGVIAGIGLICLTVLGIFILRKYRREHPPLVSGDPQQPGVEPYVYRTTEAQTGGLHEKDGSGTLYEKDAERERKSRRWTAFEMPG